MKQILKEVNCLNRRTIPSENETISDDVDIEKTIPLVKEMTIYFRDKESCPMNRGNWIVDLHMADNQLCAIKLPKEMQEKDVLKYMQPMIDRLDFTIVAGIKNEE